MKFYAIMQNRNAGTTHALDPVARRKNIKRQGKLTAAMPHDSDDLRIYPAYSGTYYHDVLSSYSRQLLLYWGSRWSLWFQAR